MRREVLLATPTFSGHPSFEFCGSCEESVALLVAAGINARHRYHPGLQFVEVARNILCTEFLQICTTATDLFFIDDDLGGWAPQKVLEFLNRPESVVAGVYPLRTDQLNFPVGLMLVDENGVYHPDGKIGHIQERNGLYRVAQIPMGFCRIKREVIEHFARTSETYGWKQADGSMMTVFDIFRKGVTGGEYVGEDMNFSARCVADGIEMWLDPDIRFKHRGSKAWEGNFSASIKNLLSQRSDLVVAARGRAA